MNSAGGSTRVLAHLADSIRAALAAERIDRSDAPSIDEFTPSSHPTPPAAAQALLLRVAAAALNALAERGYSVVEQRPPTQEPDPSGAVPLEELRSIGKDRRKLLEFWRNRDTQQWPRTLVFYTVLAESLCLHGEAFAAIDVCQEALKLFPADTRLIQLKAWALAQSGATQTARDLLTTLDEQSEPSAETFGLLARTWKDVAATETDPARKRELLSTAYKYYEESYRHSVAAGYPDYYPAINCATLRMRLGQTSEAREWAERATNLAGREPRGLWAEATLGEAALLLGEIEKAQRHYAAFASGSGHHRAVISSARRQAAEILGSNERVREVLGEFLPLPSVSVFASGLSNAEPVNGAVVICPWTVDDAGFVSTLFDYGAEVHLVLPFPLARYAKEHLQLPTDQIEIWATRATSVTIAHPRGIELTSEVAEFCALLQVGRASRLADTWSTVLHVSLPSEISDPTIRPYQAVMRALHEGHEIRKICALPRAVAFADVVGYGQLSEPQVAYFQQKLVPELARFLQSLNVPPTFVQTWGDALYLGFPGVREAGVAMLEFRKYFVGVRWQAHGFTQPLKLRLGLHCGPVLTATDPFSGNVYYTGTVVSRAARIEPLANEDQIFCSDAFAAVATALRIHDLSFAFAGTYLLPKNTGEERLFRLFEGAGTKQFAG